MSSIPIVNYFDDDCFKIRDRFYILKYDLDRSNKGSRDAVYHYFDVLEICRKNFCAIEERPFLDCVKKWIGNDSSFFIFLPEKYSIALTDIGLLKLAE